MGGKPKKRRRRRQQPLTPAQEKIVARIHEACLRALRVESLARAQEIARRTIVKDSEDDFLDST